MLQVPWNEKSLREISSVFVSQARDLRTKKMNGEREWQENWGSGGVRQRGLCNLRPASSIRPPSPAGLPGPAPNGSQVMCLGKNPCHTQGESTESRTFIQGPGRALGHELLRASRSPPSLPPPSYFAAEEIEARIREMVSTKAKNCRMASKN